MAQLNRHHIRKFMTERRVDGVKITVYAFSCTPCGVNGKEFKSKKARDHAADNHQEGKA